MANDLRPLHRLALEDASRLVTSLAEGDLERPTPCGPWDLGELLAHMIGQHLGFAAAIDSHDAPPAPPAAYEPVPFTSDAWSSSVSTLLGAFDRADLDGTTTLVEIAPSPLPNEFVVGAQLLDAAVHAWDIAHTLGQSYEPSGEIAAAVAGVAAFIPDGDGRDRDGAAFGRALDVDAGASTWARTLAHLGRTDVARTKQD